MAGRHELTLAEWTRLAPLLPARETRGTYYAEHRRVLNGMLYRHATGCAWRDRPPRYGPCSTVASRQRRWTREGLWGRILAALQGELAEAGRIDWERWCIDGSHVRAHRVAAGARENRPPPASRPTTRWGAAAAGSRPSCTSSLMATACHWPSRSAPAKPTRACTPRRAGRGARPAPQRGYSYPTIRRWLRRHGVRAVIPEGADQARQRAHRPGRKPHFDHVVYRRRGAIERTVGALKEARLVATRYEKLAIHYLALVQISMIRLLVRRLERPLSHKA